MRVVVREDPRGALPLMEQVLRAAGDLATEYPLVFREGAQGQAVVAEEDGEILSGCALLTRRLVVGEERLIVADLDHAFVRRERQNFDISGHYARPELLHIELDSRRHRGLWPKSD